MDIALLITITIVVLAALVWLGLRINPRSFSPYPQRTPVLATIPLPRGLPAPVERFYRALYGERVPVIDSAVITGKVKLRIKGIPMRGRFRFVHVAGQHYRHYIEATFFGLPLMKVNESYLDGVSRFELPFGISGGGPKSNSAANQGMWAESVWFPAIYLTDPRVRWEPLDDRTALLVVPFEHTEQRFVARFDDAGMPYVFETMRYRDEADASDILWLNHSLKWGTLNSMRTLIIGAAIWLDMGVPWAVFTLTDLVYNVDVSESVRRRGL